jgi:hypothetical protein
MITYMERAEKECVSTNMGGVVMRLHNTRPNLEC